MQHRTIVTATATAAALGLCLMASPHGQTQNADARLAAIHARTVFADLHSHPTRFHRANVARISDADLETYRRGLIDVVVCNVSSDAIYHGGYVKRDGSEVPRGQPPRPKAGEPFAFTLDRFERITKTAEETGAVLARSPQDVLDAKRTGKLALIGALEGADGLEGKVEHLRELHRRGLRLLQLVHFRANELGHVQVFPYSPGGLLDFGREAIREANRLGIVVDLAHANTETIMEAVAVSSQPMIFSHTGVKAVHQADRDLTDAEITAIAGKGGVIGIWPNGDENRTMRELMRDIDHVKQLAGVDHVGIGSDWYGMRAYTEGFGEEGNFTAIAQALLAHGYSDDEVGKVMGGNFFRVWRTVADAGGR